MNSNKLEFWKKVQAEYNSGALDSAFICHKSETFSKAWFDIGEYYNIKSLAREYIGLNKVGAHVPRYMSVLFISTNSDPIAAGYDPLDIRIKFIQFCINKFSKNE